MPKDDLVYVANELPSLAGELEKMLSPEDGL
jgi:hypothetical protein